ncbi:MULTISPECIES: winged helix-turn-helix transcriptional regulator [Haloarcula]|uniref:winged helix-turn-helix transcriptional regulator n=1 Tax=Haloarcula TaxID=2237 RepID=UPI0023EBAA6A|nr:helix-turn-helix domain-containing protein [Halomicroarcula sp. XH51]
MSSETQTLHRAHASGRTRARTFVDTHDAFATAQAVVARKWHVRIVYRLLADGPMGFSALKRSLEGISSKMLAESLAALEDDDLVDRDLLSDRPVRVEYSPTERGAALEPVLTSMLEWGAEHGDEAGEDDRR